MTKHFTLTPVDGGPDWKISGPNINAPALILGSVYEIGGRQWRVMGVGVKE